MIFNKKQRLKATILQLRSNDSYEYNLERLIDFIRANQNSKVIVVPEVYLTKYDYDNINNMASFGKKALKALKKIIDNQILVITIILKDKKSNSFTNRAVVIHNHKIVHKQDKYKLFKLGKEHKYLKAGKKNKIIPFEVDGIRFGILICFELRFKELWKALEGVDIIVIPARWGIMRKEHLEILSKALAIINQCFVLVANSKDEDMASSSAIISPSGESIFDDNSEVIVGNIDFKEIKKMRRYIVMD